MNDTHFAKKEKKKEASLNMYTTCKDIPMSKFIDVYCGNLNALVISGNIPKKEALEQVANRIIFEYCHIIGSGNMFELSLRDNIINNSIRIHVLEAAKMLISNYQLKEAIDVLFSIGMKFSMPKTAEDVRKILNKIDSNLAVYRRMLSSDQKAADKGQKETKKADRSQFMKEMSLLSAHNKFYVNPNDFTAETYAYMVKQMNNDIKQLRKWQTRTK